MELTQEIKDIFELAKTTFGAPIRKVELLPENMCSALERAMLLYNENVLNFIIESNWSTLYGKNQMSPKELAFAFSTRTLDMSRDYGDYYSHIVGLQQHGTKWELKKDYFEIVPGQQTYIVPAGRQISKVLYITNPTTDTALAATYFGGAYGFGGLGGAQLGWGAAGAFNGFGSGIWGAPFYAMPIADAAIASVDMREKNKWLGCDLVYKCTALQTGEHLINLLSVPGGRFDRMGGFGRMPKCYCWYFYYDVSPGEEDICANENPDVDLYLSPDQVKLNMKNYGMLNDGAKATVVRLFLANCAETLAFIRGKFSGNINFVNGNLTLDYSMLMDYANREKEKALNELKERLQRLSPYEVAKRDSQLVKDIIDVKKGTPLKFYIR